MPVIKSVPQHSLKRPLTVVAQDPSVHGDSGRMLTTQVEVPAEALTKGPLGVPDPGHRLRRLHRKVLHSLGF